ncbi:hypothetical protein ACT54M_17655, partial [Leptospira santarosai]
PSEFRYNRFRICYTELTLLRSEIFDNRYAVLSNAPFLRCEFPNPKQTLIFLYRIDTTLT